MAQLSTVENYIDEARVLLQDQVEPYRYTNAELLEGLNLAVLMGRTKRPDIFLDAGFTLPSFTVVDTTEVEIDAQFRIAFLYYMVGNAQLRDDEENTDARAAAFLGKFDLLLTGTRA